MVAGVAGYGALQWLGRTYGPDGPPESGCGFDVVQVQPERHLVLESTTHLPRRWRTEGRARLRWTWTFQLAPLDPGPRTRFVFRWRAQVAPWWARAFVTALIVPADAVMAHDMLHGVKDRAERHRCRPPGAAGAPVRSRGTDTMIERATANDMTCRAGEHLINTLVTNVHGPDAQLALAGTAIRTATPISVVTGNVTVAFAVLSYAGALTITVNSDADGCPDLDHLVDLRRAELAA